MGYNIGINPPISMFSITYLGFCMVFGTNTIHKLLLNFILYIKIVPFIHFRLELMHSSNLVENY